MEKYINREKVEVGQRPATGSMKGEGWDEPSPTRPNRKPRVSTHRPKN